jgi:hypothetical protein
LAGFAVVSMAWVAPRPPVPPRATSKVVAPIAHIDQANSANAIDTRSPQPWQKPEPTSRNGSRSLQFVLSPPNR